MFIYILNLFMQMSQYLNARFQEMTFSLTWNTGQILTSSNMRCKKDSKENIYADIKAWYNQPGISY